MKFIFNLLTLLDILFNGAYYIISPILSENFPILISQYGNFELIQKLPTICMLWSCFILIIGILWLLFLLFISPNQAYEYPVILILLGAIYFMI